MKELYLTNENISNKTKEFLTFNNSKKIEFSFDYKNTALLILDMQEYFLDENSHAYIPSGKIIIQNIKSLLDCYNKNNFCTIFTIHSNNEYNSGLMSQWWKGFLTEDDKFTQITSELDTSKSHIIHKSQYDAFYNTELESYLKEKEIKQLLITGVMTHLCCETTARAAFVRDFEPFFVVDATATYNENFHRATLLNLSHGFSRLISTEQITGFSL